MSTRHEFGDLFSLYEWILVGAGLVFAAAVAAAALVYRRRAGRAPSRRAEAPALEIAYALVLAAVVAVLVAFTFRTEHRVDSVPGNARVEIEVTGFQWGWRFDYGGSNVSVIGNQRRPPTLRVPVGEPVLFRITSRDVVHAFWVPALRFKRDAFPGFSTKFDLVFDRAGGFAGRCAEFCGLHHGDMSFLVRVLPAPEFDAWLARAGGIS